MSETVTRYDSHDTSLASDWLDLFAQYPDLAAVVVEEDEQYVNDVAMIFWESNSPMGLQEFKAGSRFRDAVELLVFGEQDEI